MSGKADAEFMASMLVPDRRHPYGTGWGPGFLEWAQKEGFAIRAEAERTTAAAIEELMEDG